jgi:hypothetical protein
MASRSHLVNLDSMIRREDFATLGDLSSSTDNVSTISLRDFTEGGLIGPGLRKPDFQRETNHWSPNQVVSLLECFCNGDLIPSVILWRSPTYLFVIDGGHRLSVLRAWIEDDYGDGPVSQTFFGYNISAEQKNTAKKTRELINSKVGSWKHLSAKVRDGNISGEDRRKLNALIARAIQIQWVTGDADKAENSFFKINTKGTPLDSIEELLLKNRKKPISISSRAIIRAGTGHKYWSLFNYEISEQIESSAKSLHSILFDPEIDTPIKTLDLPLGGQKGSRIAIQALIDLSLIAIRDKQGFPKTLDDTENDPDGNETIAVLSKTSALVKRVTGNDGGSLGLHPAVYFYGPTGQHSIPMFMGTITLFKRKILNNNKHFFMVFTKSRARLEDILINNKHLISSIIQKHVSQKRVEKYADFLDVLIEQINNGNDPSEQELVSMSGLNGKIVIGNNTDVKNGFSDDVKSETFITTAIKSSIRCNICNGHLDTKKSISYDHIIRSREGGVGAVDNCALTHPYCNQSVKN